MDWANERYVRLYVRDTMTWRRLGFDGQATFCLLLRKFDRAGVLEIEDMEPWEAAAFLCGVPEDVARKGVAQLLRVGVLELGAGAIVCPNYVEAQEASQSPAMRQQEHRLRRRDEIRAGLDSAQRETAIYFVQSEHGGEIKIGRADDVAKRLAGLQTGRPDKLVLLAAAHGSPRQERELHERFAKFRVKGEWFSPSPEILEMVRDVVERGSSALSTRDMSQIVTANADHVTGHVSFAVTPCLAVPSLAVPSPSYEGGAAEAASPGDGGELALAPMRPAKPPRSPTAASKAKRALRAAVTSLSASYGHEVAPTASKAHWALGGGKVAGLAAGGAELNVAAERVAKAALDWLKAGRSSSFGYSLQDCTIGAAVGPPLRPGRLAPAKANTAEDFEGDEDIAVTMARWNQNG